MASLPARAGGADGGREADLDRAAAVPLGPGRPPGGAPAAGQVAQRASRSLVKSASLKPVGAVSASGGPLRSTPSASLSARGLPDGAHARNVDPRVGHRQRQRVLPVQPHHHLPGGRPLRPVRQDLEDRHQRQQRRRDRRPPRRRVQRPERPLPTRSATCSPITRSGSSVANTRPPIAAISAGIALRSRSRSVIPASPAPPAPPEPTRPPANPTQLDKINRDVPAAPVGWAIRSGQDDRARTFARHRGSRRRPGRRAEDSRAGEIQVRLHRAGSGPFAVNHGRIKRRYILGPRTVGSPSGSST